MFNLPFKHTSTNGKFLTIDLAADEVKVVAFYLDGETLKVIGTGKEHIEPNTIRNGAILNRQTLEKSLSIAIHQAQQTSENEIDQAIFGVNGDLSLGLMTTARLTKPAEGLVTENELSDTHNKVIETAHNQAMTDILNTTGNPEVDLDLVTTTTAYTKVDDKRVDTPTQTSGKELEIAVFTAFTKTAHVKNLQKLARNLHLQLLAIGSNMYALTKCLNISKSQYIDAVIMDIGADVTDVAVVFGGSVVTTKSLPIGNVHFIQEISQKMGLTYTEAENIRRTYCAGKLTQSETMVVQHCMEDVTQLWISGLEILFAEFTGVKTFAPALYLTGEGAEIPDIIESLNMTPWTRSIAFKAPPTVSTITARDFTNIHDVTGQLNPIGWTKTVALGAIYNDIVGTIK